MYAFNDTEVLCRRNTDSLRDIHSSEEVFNMPTRYFYICDLLTYVLLICCQVSPANQILISTTIKTNKTVAEQTVTSNSLCCHLY